MYKEDGFKIYFRGFGPLYMKIAAYIVLLCCFGTIEIDVQYQIVLIYRNINENVCLSASVANFIFWLENEAYFP